jgi:hypothetical protein
MSDRPATVWVLGSGFSKALGGPLLDGLLSKSALEDTIEVFPKLPERSVVYEVFRDLKLQRWEHAEQFLEFVDLAASEDSPNHNILKRHLNQCTSEGAASITPAHFRDLATLAIAAEVSTYTEGVDVRAEAWAPYLRWAKARKGNDAVVTFNYDIVVECLAGASRPRKGMAAVLHLGEHTVHLPDGAEREHGPDECAIYKLHGSANWAWDDKARTKFKIFGSVGGFDLSDGYRPLIAMPGATKKRLCDQHLKVIWDEAMAQLRKASVIVFLGYRFPPSDSFARTSLLAAIQQNQNPYLRIHTVLGPRVRDEASARLGALLVAILEAKGRSRHNLDSHRPGPSDAGRSLYSVIQQPLYVEDFLSVLSTEMLYGKRTGTGPIAWEDD